MPNVSDQLVLIAGAGPTGIAAALELSRFGIPVRIVDEMEGPANTSRAIAVQARTLEELELRGLADELVQLGHRAEGGDIYGDGKVLVHVDFTKLRSRYNFVLFLAQTETERILRKAMEAQGVAVEWGVKITAIGLHPAGVTATLEHKDGALEEVTAAYVIDAEGAHSIIRSTIGLEFKGKTFDNTYVLGDVEVSGNLPDSSFHLFSSEQGFLGLFPMGGNRFRLVASYPTGNPPQTAAPTLEELQATYDQRSHIPVKLSQLTWSSIFHIDSRMVKTFRRGRVFLAGDSAHIHSPAGGQGMNSGIQDSINLAWKLALVMQDIAPERLLETYEEDRVPVMRSIVSRTESLTNAISGPSILRKFFIHLAPFIANADFAQSVATARISQIALNYRNSLLSEDHFGDGTLSAGDRVPELAVRVLSSAGRLSPAGTQLEMNYTPGEAKNKQSAPAATQVESYDVQAQAAGPQLTPTSAQLDSKFSHGASTGTQPDSASVNSESNNLFSLLNPSRFTLLLANFTDLSALRAQLANSSLPLEQLTDVIEIAGPAGEAGKPYEEYFGARPSITFIRPDAYVGFRGGETATKNFTEYLNRWFVVAAQQQKAPESVTSENDGPGLSTSELKALPAPEEKLLPASTGPTETESGTTEIARRRVAS